MIAFRVMVADATPRFYVAGGRVSIAGARDAGRRRTPVDFHSTESRGTPLAELTDVALRAAALFHVGGQFPAGVVDGTLQRHVVDDAHALAGVGGPQANLHHVGQQLVELRVRKAR